MSFAPGVSGLLEPLHTYLNDEAVSEILINKPEEVFIEKNGDMLQIHDKRLTSSFLRRLFLMMANSNQQVLSENTPILSGNLPDGSRIQCVIPPASLHETLSIRKFSLKVMRFEDYETQGFFEGGFNRQTNQTQLLELYQQKAWQSFLRLAIQLKKTILISGATSSGKTTFLNACVNEIPQDERLITLEDTYEIALSHPNIVRLKALKPLGDKVLNLTMQDLVQASLRLRPDRIIMGEIRGREVFDFIAASSTGHNGSIATIHADSPKGAFRRMAQLYKLNHVPSMTEEDIYQLLHDAIDVIVQLKKTPDGRKLVEVYYKDAN